jgi:autotransporter-associated beta strand protein
MAIGPSGPVVEAVKTDGSLHQIDATGNHVLIPGDVSSTAVAYGPSGQVLDVIYDNGDLIQSDATGDHALTGHAISASVAFVPSGERLYVARADSLLESIVPKTLFIGSDDSSTTFSGVISGTGNLTKVGAGTFILAGPNTYTGSTAVLGGTLLIDGSLSPSSPVSVGNGTTLGGTGVAEGPISVENENATFPTIVNAPHGNALIEVSPQTENLDSFSNGLIVNGNGTDQLVINDQNSRNDSVEYFVANTTLTRIGTDSSGSRPIASITYSGLSSLVLNPSSYRNEVFVESTAVPTTVNAGTGTDLIDVSRLDENLDDINGLLTVNGNGSAALIVNDQNSPSARDYLVSASTLTVSGTVHITYDNMATLAVDTADAGAAVNVASTDSGTFTSVITGSGVSVVNVGSPSERLRRIATLNIIGGVEGRTTVNLHDEANANGIRLDGFFGIGTYQTRPTYLVNDRSVVRSDDEVTTFSSGLVLHYPILSTINYANVSALVLNAGKTSNVFNILATAADTPVTIYTGADSDQVYVGDTANSLGSLMGPLTIDGQGNGTTVMVNDQGTTTNEGYDVTATAVSRSFLNAQGNLVPDMAPISYANVSNLAVHAGSGGYNLLFLESTAAGTNTEVYGGANNSQATYTTDAFNVGTPLDGIQGPLALRGRSNTSYVNFNDSNTGTTGAQTYTLTAGALNRTGLAPITFDGMVSDTLYTSVNIPGVVNVQGTAIPTDVVCFGAGFVTVGDASRATEDINGPVNVTDPSGATILLVDDSNDTVGRAVTLSDGSVTGLSPAAVTWTATPPGQVTGGVCRLILDGGSGDNTFNVLDTDTFYQYAAIAPGTGASNNTVNVRATTAPLYVYGNGGTDLVDVGSGGSDSGGSLVGIHGAVNVIGYGGVTSLVVDDQGSTTQEVYEVFGTEVDRTHLPDAQGNYVPDMAPITYTGLSSLTLYASTSSYNLLYVEGTAAGTRTNVYGGTDNSTPSQFTVDEFIVSGGPGDTLDDILGPLSLHCRTASAGGESLVLLNDASTAGGKTYTLTADAVYRTAMAPITFDGLIYDELFTSETAGAVVNVQGTAAGVATYVIAGAGDPVTVGFPDPILQGSTLAAIQGPLIIVAGYAGQVPAVTIDDSGDPADHPQAAISAAAAGAGYQLTGLAPAPVYLELDPATPVRILGGRGNDTFAVTSALTYTGITIDGGGGVNTLVGPDAANTWNITDATKGRLGSVAFANVQNLVGGHVNDTFMFQTAGSVGGTLDGGVGGVNTLDYSADKSDIQVDLALHMASQVASTVSNIANVTGSQGNSLLVGDANANVLQGGAGRNVIIGGAGVDTIRGGGGDNLLITDATSYDNQIAALEALMKYWDAATTFDSRVTGLKKGVTVGGLFLELNKNTVQNDNVKDHVYGGAGLNWFIADKNDILNDGAGPGSNDRLTWI